MTTIKEILTIANNELSGNFTVNEARKLTRFVLAKQLDCNLSYLIAYNNEILPDNFDNNAFFTIINRLKNKEPLARILGVAEFWSLPFYINSSTLEPRCDSEALIDAVLGEINNKNEKLNILDFGTGSGCLLLSLLSELPNSSGLGIDISNKAIAIAKKNAENLKLNDRSNFINGNYHNDIPKLVNKKFDIIISNPPYIPSNDILALDKSVIDYDPKVALDGGNDGFDEYRILVELAGNLLVDNGLLAFEIGAGQATKLMKIAEKTNQYNYKSQHFDLLGHIRCVLFEKN